MTSSNQSNKNLVQILHQFSEQYITDYQQTHACLPTVEQDEEWPSPCEQGATEKNPSPEGEVYWQPMAIEKSEELSFENVESALDLTLHNDIKTYFTLFYSESLDARCDEGELSLLFAWNKKDFERLQENLIGHILMKRRLKQKETIFFAVTDEEDMIISVDNASGAVWVERVGCKPHKQLSDSLTQFISQLTPVIK
ncbi:SecY-interacting protein [Candidatus Colwellia aromaticivorans]|uniref:SecY-interacting protein n=1 Tax=Candidatus Colwellia aromaticivorans TaxID=2267621 RepID=UPI000DF110B3|nr:SecY-interacting protein [Candidatus Colwellia aromaticivorans]